MAFRGEVALWVEAFNELEEDKLSKSPNHDSNSDSDSANVLLKVKLMLKNMSLFSASTTTAGLASSKTPQRNCRWLLLSINV